MIGVDEINPELEKIIAYVSRHASGLQHEALELELYRQGQIEILVPNATVSYLRGHLEQT
jgi:4-hydroxyphenylpyruvate dioxygenase-like putative hemolysin